MINNFSQVNVLEFKNLLNEKDVELLDIRTPQELVIYGKISERQFFININSQEFSDEISQMDKTKKYAIYCWHGNRSLLARNYMKDIGFEFVVDLKGGIDAWVKAGENIIT